MLIPEEAPQTPQPQVPRARRNAQGDIMEGLDPAAVAALQAECLTLVNDKQEHHFDAGAGASDVGDVSNKPKMVS